MGNVTSEPFSAERPDDSGETIHISSLALLKMLKHGRAGVPLEVMGLMLGEFIDATTISVSPSAKAGQFRLTQAGVQCVDVFAMPQSGTSVTVESVDHVFQTKMLDMLKQTGRPEMVVGWYHSHPGFGCWLSNVDVNTQQVRRRRWQEKGGRPDLLIFSRASLPVL